MDDVLSDLYDQYTSLNNTSNYYHLIHSNPSKFYQVLKIKHNFTSFPSETQSKIFNQTCRMIKSINIDSIQLGLKILEEIIPYIPSDDLSNSFTYNNTLTENNHGIFAYVLEEKKEIKLQTLKLITTHMDIIHTEKHFDFLIELINDEEDDVRFATIDCLSILITRISIFQFAMCDILLFALREKQTKLRRKIMLLIASMKFTLNKEQFRKVITVFKENMTLFPRDKTQIFEAVKEFSKRNCCCLTEEFFIDCFKIESNYLNVEINWEDKYYIIDFISFMEFVVWKRFELNMKIPKFFIKHFYYFEEKYPKVFNEGISDYLMKKKQSNSDTIIGINENWEDVIMNDIYSDGTAFDQWSIEEMHKYMMTNENNGRITIDQLYCYIFKCIECNINENELNKELLLRLLAKLNLLLAIEDINSNLIETNELIIQSLSQGNSIELLNQIVKLKEDTRLLLTEELKQKRLIQIDILHPESYQTYLNPNRRDSIFPFSLPIHIKISNLTNQTPLTNQQSIQIMLMKRMKVSLINKDNQIEKSISLLPSSDATITCYQSSISIKKKEMFFLKKSTNQTNNSNSNTNLQLKLRCGLFTNLNNEFNFLIEDTVFTIQSK